MCYIFSREGDTVKYKINISVNIRDYSVSLSWKEDFSRDYVKDYFNPSNNIRNTLLYPPEADLLLDEGDSPLTDDERAEIEEELERRTEDFEFDVIFPDSLKIWTEDLTAEYTRLTQNMAAGKLAEYESRYHEIQSMTDKEESVRRLYSLVEEMKS